MSIRNQRDDYEKYKMLGLKTPISDGKLPGAVEDLAKEVFNKGDEHIWFENIHPLRHKMHFHGKPPEYWMRLDCPPGEWVFLPHSMYVFHCPSGNQQYPVIENYGDEMFKGNKLPSRPEASKIRSFVPGLKKR